MVMRKSILDEIILNIEGNPWTVRDACTGCIVFGMTGSGSACFAVFADEAAAQSAARAFRGKLRLIRTRTVVPPVRAGERR